jgi:hypothetical protein
MAIPSRQIGWGTEENLLWQISKQLETLTKVVYNIGGNTPSTTTTTTTSASGTTLYLSSISPEDACAQTGPIVTITSITFNGGTSLCDSSSLNSPDVNALSSGAWYVSDGGTNVRIGGKAPGVGITLLTFSFPSECTSC